MLGHSKGKALVLVVYTLVSITYGFSQNLDTLWTRTYGGTGDDYSYFVQETNDGGYVIMGHTYSYGAGDANFYLIKTNPNGDTLWTSTFGGPNQELCYAGQQTSDHGYVMTGSTGIDWVTTDVYIIKADSLGNLEWAKTYGLAPSDQARSIRQTWDGGYIVTGYTNSFGAGDRDVWLIKTDGHGDTLWTKTYGGTGSDAGWAIQQTIDGGYIIAGYTLSFSPNGVWVLKTDAYGDTLWSTVYGQSGYWGRSVQQTSDSGYIVSGNDSNFDIFLLKTDSAGSALWSKVYVADGMNFGNSVKQTIDGGYVVVSSIGNFPADLWFLRTDSLGDTLWTKAYGGTGNEEGWSISLTADGGYIITGATNSYGAGAFDIYVIKTLPDTLGITEHDAEPHITTSLEVSPNPFTHNIKIRYSILDSRFSMKNPAVSIYDACGRLVRLFNQESNIQNLESEVSWDGRDDDNRMLPSGVYFLKFEAENHTVTEKLLLIR